MDFKKKAVELVRGIVVNTDEWHIGADEIEQALKETWNEAIEKVANEAEEASWMTAKEIRALKVGKI